MQMGLYLEACHFFQVYAQMSHLAGWVIFPKISSKLSVIPNFFKIQGKYMSPGHRQSICAKICARCLLYYHMQYHLLLLRNTHSLLNNSLTI